MMRRVALTFRTYLVGQHELAWLADNCWPTPQRELRCHQMLAAGDRVRIVGLESRPEFNGAWGSVVSFSESNSRFLIQLPGVMPPNTRPLALKPINLVKDAPYALLGRCDGVGAFSTLLYDNMTVARVTLRVHEGLSQAAASCDVMPKDVFLQVASQHSGRPCSSVPEATEAMCATGSETDRDWTIAGEAPPPRPWFVDCPPELAGSLLSIAKSATPADVLRRTEITATCTPLTQAQTMDIFAAMAGQKLQPIAGLVESWAKQAEAVTLMAIVATFDLETAAYQVLNKRGEYREWGFNESLKQLFGTGYKARRLVSSSTTESLRERVRELLGALVNDRRLGARTCVAKCDLMCEHMAAFHLLRKEKMMAALFLVLRDNVREVGLRDSAFGFAMMLFNPPLPDGTRFTPLAEELLKDQDMQTKILAMFTALPLEKVLQMYHGDINARGGVGLQTPAKGSLTFGKGTEHLDEPAKQQMRDMTAETGRNIEFFVMKISDYAHLDEKVGLPDLGGHWAVRMMQTLRQRKDVSIPCEQAMDAHLVEDWIRVGPQTLEALEVAADAGEPAAMLKLADVLMCCGFGITDETRDPKRACNLYYGAAGYDVPEEEALPEAMIQVANVVAAKLLGTEWQGNRRSLRTQDASDPVYAQIIYWLGKAAKRGYVAPPTLWLGEKACRVCSLAGSGLEGASDVVAAICARELERAAGLRSKMQDARKQSAHEALAQAETLKKEGNEAIQSGDNAAAAVAYDEASSALAPFESVPGVAWPLLLCLSNHAEAMVRLGRHAEALDSCNDAAVILERYEANFRAEEVTRLAAKIESREKAAIKAAEEAAEQVDRDAATAAREARKEEQRERARRESETAAAKARALAARRAVKEAAKKQRQSEAAAQRHAAAEREAQLAEEAAQATALREAQEAEAAEQARAQRQAEAARAEQQRAEERAAAIQQREARAARRRAARAERDALRARAAQAPASAQEVSAWGAREFERRLRLEQEQREGARELNRWRQQNERARSAGRAAFETAAAAPRAEDVDQECCICFDDNTTAPLQDFCGYGHLLHDGCARGWREQCRQNKKEPHCPTCQRPWENL